MKKNVIFVVITTIVLATIMIFVGCEKKDGNKDIVSSGSSNDVEFYYNQEDYDVYIENLMAETGIDIYEISKLDVVQRMVDKHINMTNALSAEMMHTKNTISNDKLAQIHDLSMEIEAEYEAGNYDKVYVLYETFCSICITIDGFYLNINEYGLQTITYDPNKDPVRIPVDWMEMEQNNAAELINTIEGRYSQFNTLPEPTKIDVVAAAMYVNIQQNTITTKAMTNPGGNDDLSKCINDANSTRDVEFAKADASFGVSLLSCGLMVEFPYLAVACGIYATVKYVRSCNNINQHHETHVKLCNRLYS